METPYCVFTHAYPDYIVQFVVHPSPLKALPSSHEVVSLATRFTPSPHLGRQTPAGEI